MGLQMHRGKLQSLYQFMPDQTYNWEKGQGSFRGAPDVDAVGLDIPEGWVARPLSRLLRGFTGTPTGGGSDAAGWRGLEIITRGDFQLLEPRTLRGEFFPRVFFCAKCGRVLDNLDERPDRVTCFACKHRMQQLAFVEYHRCGHLSGLQPPRCAHGCKRPMKLVGPDGSPRSSDDRRFSEWRWRCSQCNVEANRGVYRGCPTCGRGQVRIAPADAGPVYYAQDITVINPPREQDWSILSSDNIYRAAVAQALGLVPAGLDGLRDALNDATAPTNTELLRQNLITQFRLKESDPGDRELLEQLMERHRRKGEESQGETHWEEEVDALGLAPEDLEEVGSECIELALTLDPGGPDQPGRTITIKDMIEENPESPRVATYSTRYPAALDRYGIAKVTLIKEFPIARIVAGYTREEKNPRAMDGLTFHFYEGEGGKKAMYGQRTITEALLVEVDTDRIVSWLNRCTSVASGSRSGLGELLGGQNSKAWLFKHLRPVTSAFDDPDDILTRAVLGLLHSMSHRLIRALTERSGLKADSITEKILPYNGAFLIYPGGRSDFILGGLEHVFRNHLDEAFSSADEEARCVFDPPCNARGGACAVCMYLSEVSCERFNTALSRHYLFGGTSRGVRWRGFWRG